MLLLQCVIYCGNSSIFASQDASFSTVRNATSQVVLFPALAKRSLWLYLPRNIRLYRSVSWSRLILNVGQRTIQFPVLGIRQSIPFPVLWIQQSCIPKAGFGLVWFDLSGALLCFQGQWNGLLMFGIFKQHCSYDSICYLFSRRYVLLVVDQLYFLLKFLTLSSVVTKDSIIFAMHDSVWVAVFSPPSISNLSDSCFFSQGAQRQWNRHEINIRRRHD